MNSNNLNFNKKKELASAENSSIEVLKELSQDSDVTIRQAVANNSNTPLEILQELRKDIDPNVREAVAGNPNTSIEDLKELAEEFPEAITANPIFDLLLLENPESDFIRLSLARSSTTPAETLLKLIEDKNRDVQLAAIANPNTSLEILEKIAKSYQDDSEWQKIYEAISRNPNASSALLNFIAEKAENIFYKEDLQSQVARHPNTSPSTLDKLLYSQEKTRFYALKHPNISKYAISIIQFVENKLEPDITLLNKLVSHSDYRIRTLVAKHNNVPVEILEKLIEDKDTDVQLAVITNPNTTLKILEKIAESYQDDDSWEWTKIYLAISSHPKASSVLLNLIAEKAEKSCYGAQDIEAIQSQVARHPNTSTSTLDKLFYSQEKTRFYALQHPNISDYALSIIQFIEDKLEPDITLLNKLANHSDYHIRRLVAKHNNVSVEILEKLIEDKDTDVQLAAIANPNTPLKILEKIAESYQDDDSWKWQRIYKAISRNPNASSVLLNLIAEKAEKSCYGAQDIEAIQSQVARHRNTSTSTLDKLFYSQEKTRFYALQHPNISDYVVSIIQFIENKLEPDITVFNKLVNNSDHYIHTLIARYNNVPVEILEKLAKHENEYVREAVAKNPNITSIISYQLAEDKTWRARRGVAQNKKTPPEILIKLSCDRSKQVRKKVALNINTPVNILEQLKADKESDVREAVARNRNTSSNILKELAKDTNVSVQLAVVKNRNISSEILQKLSTDKDKSVAALASKKLEAIVNNESK